MIHNNIEGLFKDIIIDKRSVRRFEKITDDMLTFGTAVVNRFSKTHKEKIGAYRMLSNDKFSYGDLSQGLYKVASNKQVYPHLLCIQDTSEINLSKHKDLFNESDQDIGTVTRKNDIGFFCHPMLVVDPAQSMPLGYSSIELYNRKWLQANKYERNYKNIPIESKESFRWISSVNKTKEVLPDIPKLTIIGDRESDIFEEMALIPDQNTDLLIRLTHNRNVFDSSYKLFEVLENSPKRETFSLKIKSNRKRKDRTAIIAVRYVKVKIKRPAKTNKKDYPPYIELWAIEARELKKSVPENESPILWRLLTTHEIHNTKDALTYISWYKQRWLIEELFRVLKRQGLDIESSQLATGAAIKKLTIIALFVALTTMQLKLAMQCEEDLPIELAFDDKQQTLLKIMNKEVQGTTQKQKNPYNTNTLAWAAWIIARLSGWSGYGSHGPAGYISLKRGLDIFNAKFQGFTMALKFLQKKDVYKE